MAMEKEQHEDERMETWIFWAVLILTGLIVVKAVIYLIEVSEPEPNSELVNSQIEAGRISSLRAIQRKQRGY